MLSTTPANSEAGENGNGGFTWYLPAISSVSKKLSAADLIATTTSPEAGVGSGKSVNSRSSGPPKRVQRTAFMAGFALRGTGRTLSGAKRAVTCAKRGCGGAWCLHIADFPRYFYDFRGSWVRREAR